MSCVLPNTALITRHWPGPAHTIFRNSNFSAILVKHFLTQIILIFFRVQDLKNESPTSQEPRRALQTGGGSTISGYCFEELRGNCWECGSLQKTLQVPSLPMMQQRPEASCHCPLQPHLQIPCLPQLGTQTASHRCLVHQHSFGWMFLSQSGAGRATLQTAHKPHRKHRLPLF